MRIFNTETAPPGCSPAASIYTNSINYDTILKDYNLPYRSTEFYWQVGEINIEHGWVLHISVVRPQIPALLHLLLPIFLSNEVAFKIVRDSQVADYSLEGALGTKYQCKILAIYPNDNNHALHLAKEIIAVSGGFKGPSIPTDRLISGIVYAQFINLSPQKQKDSNGQHITAWPFQEIQGANIFSRPQKLLRLTYYPVSIIKRDSKGDVIKALYFKKPWKVRTCIIKQGRKCMLFDDAGRDIQDRLSWQYGLHQQLAEHLLIPKAIEFFIENEDAYLVLDFIKGAPFTNLIEEFYKINKWNTNPAKNQILLTNYLLGIIQVIQHLHEKGFVHRDITPENFFIDQKRRIWLLDVELMWALDSNEISVPFQTGTLGFMSPEQQEAKIPTIKEDIYAVGALLLCVFTNLHPFKFALSKPKQLRTILYFLIGGARLVKIIGECLSANPHQRPDLGMVTTALESYQENLQQKESVDLKTVKPQLYTLSKTGLKETIQMAIHGLRHPSILSTNQCWISNMITSEEIIKNPQVGAMVYAGWHTGVAGPLWLIAIANKNGFDIESCLNPYQESWKFIAKQDSSTHTDASLYTGTAGVSLALSAAFNSHLLEPDGTELQLGKLFEKTTSGPTLSSGVAGQGLALLQARRCLESGRTQQVLQSYAEFILSNQRPDGSWHVVPHQNRSRRIELTLANGVPGIVWFLLHYLDSYPDDKVLRSVVKACNWLLKTAFKKSNNDWPWPIINNSKSGTLFSTDNGIPGLLLVLIKAFTITGDRRYADTAESSLKRLPDQPHFSNFTLSNGLAGIGEVYLEAFKAFNDKLWLRRAGWIAQLFVLSFQSRTSSNGFWVMEGEQSAMADLFTGNSGAIHFLMHYLLPNKLRHPLVPDC